MQATWVIVGALLPWDVDREEFGSH